MPSRKRAKGKARKAKARESNCNLILHNENVCRHGCEVISKDDVCYKFVEQLEVEMKAVYDLRDDIYLAEMVNETIDLLKARKEYVMIWDNDSKDTRQKLQSLLINLGTNLLLRGDKRRSINLVSVVIAFCVTIGHHEFNYWKAMDSSRHRVSLRNAADGLIYDSAKFFHKRIPCQCLEKIYLRERPKPRLSECSYCKEVKDRRELYLCSSCLYHHYCGVDCQTKHWPKHKLDCKDYNPRTDCGL